MRETIEKQIDDRPEPASVDPLQAAIVQAILIAGILAVHFGVVRLW